MNTFFARIFALRDSGINPATIISLALPNIGVSTIGIVKVQGTSEEYWIQYNDGRRVSLDESQLKSVWDLICYSPPPPRPF
jgi:hypothetical protein